MFYVQCSTLHSHGSLYSKKERPETRPLILISKVYQFLLNNNFRCVFVTVSFNCAEVYATVEVANVD